MGQVYTFPHYIFMLCKPSCNCSDASVEGVIESILAAAFARLGKSVLHLDRYDTPF